MREEEPKQQPIAWSKVRIVEYKPKFDAHAMRQAMLARPAEPTPPPPPKPKREVRKPDPPPRANYVSYA